MHFYFIFQLSFLIFKVLRESKTTNATSYPPPLHPISQLYNVGGKNSSDSPDSIKITENPDSAVITPIPKKEEGPQLPEKRKKTMSNILRTGERRPKKQNLSKTLVDNMDNSFPINSDHEQDRKKSTNDDDITLIKVSVFFNLFQVEKQLVINYCNLFAGCA